MSAAWPSEDLERISAAEELQIAPRRADGTLRRAVTIWVVRVGDQACVRTWYRRGDGWFAHALESGRARISVPGTEADVTVEDVSDERGAPRADVDAAYRSKYQRYGETSVGPMVNDDAAATTLRLTPDQGAGSTAAAAGPAGRTRSVRRAGRSGAG